MQLLLGGEAAAAAADAPITIALSLEAERLSAPMNGSRKDDDDDLLIPPPTLALDFLLNFGRMGIEEYEELIAWVDERKNNCCQISVRVD